MCCCNEGDKMLDDGLDMRGPAIKGYAGGIDIKEPGWGGLDDFYSDVKSRASNILGRGSTEVTSAEAFSNEARAAAEPKVDTPAPTGIPRWALWVAAGVVVYLVVK